MALRALTLTTVRQVQLKRDPDYGTDRATVFHIGTLDARIAAWIKDQSTKFDVPTSGRGEDDLVSTQINVNQMHYLAVQFGLRGFDRLVDDDGNDLGFVTKKRNVAGKSYEVVSEQIIDRLHHEDIAELGRQILGDNTFGEADAGN